MAASKAAHRSITMANVIFTLFFIITLIPACYLKKCLEESSKVESVFLGEE